MNQPLPNIKHEIFARKMIENNGNQTQSYAQTYEDSNPVSSRTHASRLMATNGNVRDRIGFLMEDNGLGLADLTREHKVCLDSDDGRLKLSSVKLGYQVLGVLDAAEQGGGSHQHIHLHEADVAQLSTEERLKRLRDMTR